MKRKVIQLAGKTFVMSLPTDWVREWGVKKGEELEMVKHGPKLIVSTSEPRDVKRGVVDVSGANERTLRWLLSSLHKKGYDEIEVVSESPEHAKVIDELLKELFIGFTVVHRSGNRSVVRAVSKDLDDQFDVMLRRAFLVTLSMGERVLEAAKNGKNDDVAGIRELEKQNNQLTNFCERILNKRGHNEPLKANFLYVVVWNLEKIADDFKYVCDVLPKGKLEKATVDVLEETLQLFRGYYGLFYKFDVKRLSALADEHKRLREKIEKELPGKNAEVLIHLHHTVLKCADFSASMFAVHD